MATGRELIRKQRIFEARYEKGYRYLDRCGDVMAMLEDCLTEMTGCVWLPEEMAPTGARLICPQLEITLVLNARHLIVDQTPVPDVQCDFDAIAETSLAMILGRLEIRELNRFGGRRVSVLPTSSIDEAEGLSVRQIPVGEWYKGWLSASGGFERRAFDMRCVFELPDRSRGIRLKVGPFWKAGTEWKLDERLKSPPHLLPSGQREALMDQMKLRKQRQTDPEAGLVIDIDYYWVWPSGDAIVSDFLKSAWTEIDRLEKEFLEKRSTK